MNIDQSRFPNNQTRSIADQNLIAQKAESKESIALVDKGTSTNQRTTPVATPRVDKIELSNKVSQPSVAFDIAKLKTKIVADISQDADASKIQNIQQKIAAGTYKIDPNEIAKYILNI